MEGQLRKKMFVVGRNVYLHYNLQCSKGLIGLTLTICKVMESVIFMTFSNTALNIIC